MPGGPGRSEQRHGLVTRATASASTGQPAHSPGSPCPGTPSASAPSAGTPSPSRVRAAGTGQTPPLAWPPTDDQAFAAMVTAVTAAFGDPTRRAIYLYARRAEGVTASEVARHFALHPNVARHHLDRLAAGGYLEAMLERARDGGAGRPSRRYRSPRGLAVTGGPSAPGNPAALVFLLLERLLDALPRDIAECLAEEVGEEYGRALGLQMSPGESTRSVRAALGAVADALTAHGFAARLEAAGPLPSVVADACPFGDAAVANPVLCAVDRGMVRGMLAALSGQATPVRISSRARGDEVCSAQI